MPERKNNKLLTCDAIVNVVPGAREIESTYVRVVARRAASAYAGLLGEHFQCFRQVQSNRFWSSGAVVRPPKRGAFDLR
jgi:hypothetical protein